MLGKFGILPKSNQMWDEEPHYHKSSTFFELDEIVQLCKLLSLSTNSGAGMKPLLALPRSCFLRPFSSSLAPDKNAGLFCSNQSKTPPKKS